MPVGFIVNNIDSLVVIADGDFRAGGLSVVIRVVVPAERHLESHRAKVAGLLQFHV